MGTTINDIALAAKVSHTTVSRALNGSSLINRATRDRILRVARQMGYSRGKFTATDKCRTIGLFFASGVNGMTPDFFHRIVAGANSALGGEYCLAVHRITDFSDFTMINSQNFAGILYITE